MKGKKENSYRLWVLKSQSFQPTDFVLDTQIEKEQIKISIDFGM